jgi:hypothetical protein
LTWAENGNARDDDDDDDVPWYMKETLNPWAERASFRRRLPRSDRGMSLLRLEVEKAGVQSEEEKEKRSYGCARELSVGGQVCCETVVWWSYHVLHPCKLPCRFSSSHHPQLLFFFFLSMLFSPSFWCYVLPEFCLCLAQLSMGFVFSFSILSLSSVQCAMFYFLPSLWLSRTSVWTKLCKGCEDLVNQDQDLGRQANFLSDCSISVETLGRDAKKSETSFPCVAGR